MIKAVIWSRVSTREQKEEGYTIDQQRKDSEKYAIAKDFEIARKFDVAESAKGDKPRVIFNGMMEYVLKHNVKIIICDRIDRITRNLKDSVLLYDWINADSEREIHFTRNRLVINKDSKTDGKFRWDIEVVLAKRYSDELSEKVKGGNMEKGEQGWFPGSRKRGYLTLRPTGNKHVIWVKNERPDSELPYI